MKKNEKKSRITVLEKGKTKNLSIFERIPIIIDGHIDGVKGLVRETEGKIFESPFIDKEIRSFDEFSTRIYGRRQIEDEEDYSRLGELIDSVLDIKKKVANSEVEFNNATGKAENAVIVRKHGEERLTNAQVEARRRNELAKGLEPFKNRVNELQSRLKSETDELSKLYNKILEADNSTRLICNRVEDHMKVRINVYWTAVLCRNPKLPAVPTIEVPHHTEKLYKESHRQLMERAEAVLTLFNDKKEEK